MTREERKKVIEGWAFRNFCLMHEVPEGDVIQGDCPDIVIHAQDHRIGIDATAICHEGAMAAAGERASVMQSLQQMLVQKRVPSVDVSMQLTCPAKFRRGGRLKLAERLANYVERRVPQAGEVFARRASEWPLDEDLPAEVYGISIARYEYLTQTTCDATEAVFVPELQASNVERCVRRKNPCVQRYRERCSETWLLMYVNAAELATAYSFETFAPPAAIPSDFDRMFLLSILEPRVYEIPCA